MPRAITCVEELPLIPPDEVHIFQQKPISDDCAPPYIDPDSEAAGPVTTFWSKLPAYSH